MYYPIVQTLETHRKSNAHLKNEKKAQELGNGAKKGIGKPEGGEKGGEGKAKGGEMGVKGKGATGIKRSKSSNTSMATGNNRAATVPRSTSASVPVSMKQPMVQGDKIPKDITGYRVIWETILESNVDVAVGMG